ncbi:MAG: DNA-methyltransferase [Phycisphaerales bacterium]
MAIAAHVLQADWISIGSLAAPGTVDLVYADPPFNTGKARTGRSGRYADSWPTLDDYITWLRPRVAAAIRLLKPSGNLLLHVDWRTSHRARVLLDSLLGEDRFVNHLVWSYGLGGSSPRRFARKHDDILWYCIDPARAYFKPPRVPATSNRMRGQTKKMTDVLAVPSINNMAAERTGYPTQKPLALLDLLVRACCPPGGLVLDPCCGSGTTLVAAAASGRNALGCDTNAKAVALARKRLDALTK